MARRVVEKKKVAKKPKKITSRKPAKLDLNSLADMSMVLRYCVTSWKKTEREEAEARAIARYRNDRQTPETCEFCKFFHDNDMNIRPNGFCQRMPPIILGIDYEVNGEIATGGHARHFGFPIVPPNLFCGEWKPRR